MPSLQSLPHLAQGISALSQLAAAETDAQTKCINITHCRTIWNIVWSCLATNFAGACVRNIPDPRSSAMCVGLERVAMAVFAVLSPEYMIGWAVRQWLTARRIARTNEVLAMQAREPMANSVVDNVIVVPFEESWKKLLLEEAIKKRGFHKKATNEMKRDAETAGVWKSMWCRFRMMHFSDDGLCDWTVTHGFLVLMGGFYYLEPGEDPRPLSPREVEACIMDGSLELPTKSQINDKSKSDAFSRTVASLQMIWFVMQSLARPIQQLPLTMLEVVTLAYTLITVALHLFWWSKPLNIGQPFRVRRFNFPDPTIPTAPTTPATSQKLRRKLETLMKAMMGSQDYDADLSQLPQVPTFSAGEPTQWETIRADVIALGFAMMFGAIHCAAWSFGFPSHAENLIWCIASTAVVGVPVLHVFLLVLWVCKLKNAVKFLTFLSLIAIPFYILARMVLLVLAFTTLRSLPLAALETVHWTTFIPHI